MIWARRIMFGAFGRPYGVPSAAAASLDFSSADNSQYLILLGTFL